MGSSLEASWCVLRGHKALTAARGANPALHSSHIALPPLVILLTRRTQAVQSITVSLPSPLRLLLWSAAPCFPFINTVFDVGFIILCQPPNTSMCVIVLDSSQWRGYLARLSWYWAKGLLSMYLPPQISVLSIFSV